MQVVLVVAALLGLGWLVSTGGNGSGRPTSGGAGGGALRERVESTSSQTDAFASEVQMAASSAGVPADILLSVVQQESSGDPDARGPGGEVGLMQLKQIAVDDVAENTPLPRVDVSTLDARAPQENLKYGAEFLKLQRQRVASADGMDGWFDALRSYNCGFGGARQSPSCGSRYASEVLGRTPRGVTA